MYMKRQRRVYTDRRNHRQQERATENSNSLRAELRCDDSIGGMPH